MILKNTDLKNFIELIKGKEIICFGAGKYLDLFFAHCPAVNQIKFIVDNKPDKWNTFREIGDQRKEILSPNQISSSLNNGTILLITAGVIGVEIFHQLESMNLPELQDVYWSAFIFNEPESKKFLFERPLPEDLKLTKAPIIPKKIHYCWVGNSSIPQEHQKYIDGWKRLCPDYEIICWNEKNYDIGKNLYMKQAYEQKKWGFVPDFIRIDVIYEHGGIYLDTDVEMVKRPDELLYQDGFCGIEFAPDKSVDKSFKVNLGLGFGARKGLPILKSMRDIYNDEIFNFREGTDMKTGPDYETEFLEKHGMRINNGYQIIENMTIYPLEVLSGTTFFSKESFITENTFTVHHYANSWKDKTRRDREIEARRLYNLCQKV